MSRQKNPAAAVLAYFETAELGAAEVVLSLARAIVTKRQPNKLKRVRTTNLPPIGTAKVAPPPLNQVRRRRTPQDVPLPGLPGPVSTVGD